MSRWFRKPQINQYWWRVRYVREPQGRSDYPMIMCVLQIGPFLWLWDDWKTKAESRRQEINETRGRS